MKLNSQSTVLFGIWRLRVKKKQIPKRCGLGMDHRGAVNLDLKIFRSWSHISEEGEEGREALRKC